MRGRAFAALLLLPFLGAAAGGEGRVPGVTDTEIVIGVTTALSGPAAAWGNSGVGMQAWAQYVNDQGGVHGRRIRVVLKDDGHHPGRAVSNLKELKDSAFAIVGLLGSATLNAAKDDIARYRIPLVNPYGNPAIWARQPRDRIRYVFVNHPDYLDEGDFLVTHAVTRLGATKVAVFYQNDEMGLGGLEGVRQGIGRLAGRAALAAEVGYEVTDRGMGVHALKLRESGADTVVLYATATHGANLLKETAKLGYRPRVLSSFPLGDHVTMFRLVGELWEGAHYSVIWSVRGEAEADRVVEILLRYEPRLLGKETYGLSGAIPMMIAVEGLRRAGRNLTREGFVEAMETIQNFSPENLTAPITFGPSRRHGANAFRLMRAVSARDNRVVPVTGYQIFPPRY